MFKSNLNELSRGSYKTEDQKSSIKILNCITNHKNLLLNYVMIFFELHLRLNIKQLMEKNV